MGGKLQEHQQELERMKQQIELDRKKLVIESRLKKKEIKVCFADTS